MRFNDKENTYIFFSGFHCDKIQHGCEGTSSRNYRSPAIFPLYVETEEEITVKELMVAREYITDHKFQCAQFTQLEQKTKSSLSWIQNHDLYDTGALLYQLSPTHCMGAGHVERSEYTRR